MKTIDMTIKEFLNFKMEAIKHEITFQCKITSRTTYKVTASIEFLESLGF